MKISSFLLAAMLTALTSLTVQPQERSDKTRNSSTATSAQSLPKRQITIALVSSAKRGGVLTITSDQSLTDFVTYRSGERSYWIFPQSTAVKGALSGFGFADVRLEERDDDVVVSVRFENGETPVMHQSENRIEMTASSNTQAFENLTSKPIGMASSVTAAIPKGQTVSLNSVMKSSANSQPGPSSPVHNSPSPATLSPAPPQVQAPLSFLPSSEKIKEAEIDLSVPESPAFTILGLTPQTVIRPTTPREFATSLLNGVDDKGNFQSGIAIDTVPYLLFFGNDLTLDRYRKSFGTRLFSRTQFSFATTKGTGDQDKTVRVALGLHATIFDKGDPRTDHLLTQCFNDNLSFPPMDPSMSIDEREAFLANQKVQLLATYKEKIDDCRQRSRDRNWNRSSLLFGAAPSWISLTGNSSDLKWNGGGVWMSFAYGFEGVEGLNNAAQLIFHTRYRNQEQVADQQNAGQFIVQDSFYAGMRFRVGKPDFAASFESTYVRNMPDLARPDDQFRLSFGAEKKLSNNLWLQFSIGGEGGRTDGKGQLFVLSSFKYAFSKERTFEDRFSQAVQQ